jgi:hypothetical protein
MSTKAPPILESGTGAPSIFSEVPGVYVTRNGHEVEIHERRGGSHFPIKGSVRYYNVRGAVHHRVYNIWTEDGRNLPYLESPLDIVGVFQR